MSPQSVEVIARTPFVLGNWKMNVNKAKVLEILKFLNQAKPNESCDVVVGVPAAYFECVSHCLSDAFQIAAQNCYQERTGAFTGEVSTDMIKDFNVKYVILGHVERRNLFGETNELISQKIKHALAEGFHVVVCVDDFSSNERLEDGHVLREQLTYICESVTDWNRVVIAYDSIQATRSNIPLTAKQVENTHASIRRFIEQKTSFRISKNLRIIYGGCVSAKNCESFAGQNNIDGFLIGSNSLTEEFLKIISTLSDVKTSIQP